MKHSKWFSVLTLVVLLGLCTPIAVRADMAPPEEPPAINILPGGETTQVRMVAETVTLTVRAKSSNQKYGGQADTEAVFTMRNLGTETETMEARFPLSFFHYMYVDNFPEIDDFKVFIAGKPVQTKRVEVRWEPWAFFWVSFPPGKDVIVTVKYTTNSADTTKGFFDGTKCPFNYIFETGAGWKGTIGSADIIFKLPYDASNENVVYYDEYTLVGKEVRWHLSDFEPTTNFSVEVVCPEYWQKVVKYRDAVEKYPDNGEFWGQLGKAIKEVIRAPKGYLRSDPAGKKMYQEAFAAYQKSVQLLPKDALWHYGFADLLWSDYYFNNDWHSAFGEMEMTQIVDQLHQSLALDPENAPAKELTDWIAGFDAPYIRKKADGSYDFPVLTATLTAIPATETPAATPTTIPATVTLIATPTTIPPTLMPNHKATFTFSPLPWPTNPPTLTAVPATSMDIPVSPTQTPTTGQPLCGAAAMMVLPALVVFGLAIKRK